MFPPPPATVLRSVLRNVVPVAIILTIYLYLYPVFQQCAFPLPLANDRTPSSANDDADLTAFLETAKYHFSFLANGGVGAGNNGTKPSRSAPFRLLALGDPQLEGDTSIPNARSSSFPHLISIVEHVTFHSNHSSLLQRVRQTLHDVIDFYFEDIPNTFESIRKRIDLFGNDYYLAHIYRTVHWWTAPTHVVVLGDLLGSQWIEDDEFERRAHRFWTRVVRGGERVSDDLALFPADEYDLAGYLGTEASNETEAWARRIINVVGNHDIGYAGDINEDRLDRFERLFGKANYELRFEIPVSALSSAAAASIYDEITNRESNRLAPELRIVNLNDMNLDTPALSSELQDATYHFINSVINTASAVEFSGHFTMVLTHIPLHKPEGVCVDAPFFAFHEHDGTLREQNLLSADASRGFLEGIFGMHGDTNAAGNGQGRKGIILNGHDHEGCDTFHYINQLQGASWEDRAWDAMRWIPARDGGIVGKPGYPGVREITVRSMMGDFGGNAGLLSLWFDEESWEWKFEYATCALGRQHLWWLVHILDGICVVAAVAYCVLAIAKTSGWDIDRWPTVLVPVSTGKVTGKKEPLSPKSTVVGDGTALKPSTPSP